VTSVSNDYKSPTAGYTEPRYSDTEVKRPPSKKSVQDDAVLATGAFCENQVDSIEKMSNWLPINIDSIEKIEKVRAIGYLSI